MGRIIILLLSDIVNTVKSLNRLHFYYQKKRNSCYNTQIEISLDEKSTLIKTRCENRLGMCNSIYTIPHKVKVYLPSMVCDLQCVTGTVKGQLSISQTSLSDS